MNAPEPLNAPLPLSRLTVLDLTLARAGPTCVRHLADWGANVIRVEPPAHGNEDIVGNRVGPDFQNLHRNKRVITLNLKDPAGHAAFMRLVKTADVIVENMRADVKGRLKIAWEDVHAVNPRLVYGSISGFGQSGPYSHRPGVDQIAQGMGGLMSVTGEPGKGPVRVGVAINDLTAGNLLALSIMMALYERHYTGVGRWVHTSLLESQIFLLDFQASRYLIKGEIAKQVGNNHPTSVPTGVFPTADGAINIAASSTRLWPKLCDLLGHPEWKDKAEWKTQIERRKHRADVHAAVAEVTRTKTSAHWDAACDKAGIPCGPINTIDQVFADPQVRHLEMAQPVKSPQLGELNLVATPINMSGLNKALRSATPDIGEHTTEVLKSVGYSDAEIEDLRKAEVI
ncbi:MAG TPA: CaiB/BaiF CoA-transferase family protein [Burkholderiales bacterium]|nr:CaiB/BaiF CoA-transferase family protein [Burkholderiales bacterium]